MITKNIFTKFILFIFIFSLLFFREYLYTYRMMLTNFVPYELYQNQILYFSTFNDNYKMTLPAAIRLIPILFYYLIYKIIPCLKLTNVNTDLSEEYICATHALAIGNYFILISILVIFFYYQIRILKRSKQEGYLSMLICYRQF